MGLTPVDSIRWNRIRAPFIPNGVPRVWRFTMSR